MSLSFLRYEEVCYARRKCCVNTEVLLILLSFCLSGFLVYKYTAIPHNTKAVLLKDFLINGRQSHHSVKIIEMPGWACMLFLLLLTSDERMASDGWMLNESQEALIEGERICGLAVVLYILSRYIQYIHTDPYYCLHGQHITCAHWTRNIC